MLSKRFANGINNIEVCDVRINKYETGYADVILYCNGRIKVVIHSDANKEYAAVFGSGKVTKRAVRELIHKIATPNFIVADMIMELNKIYGNRKPIRIVDWREYALIYYKGDKVDCIKFPFDRDYCRRIDQYAAGCVRV